MDFEFKTKHLTQLYETGCSRKYRLPKGVAHIFVERINRIQSAQTINDLRIPPSMRFEKLEGFNNRFSIRVNKQYRLEFEIDFEDEEKTRGFVIICELSNHYN